ncbi:MAG TPA: hypothetical protein VL096_16905 [Pirellulaceae bacterium]|nr:hypothetical protein [Pirellulaceae bacterium]
MAILKVFTRDLHLEQPETLVEAYQRGVDLVATYAQLSERTIRPQVYWRYLESAEMPGLELILSAQTSLLDSQPQTRVESTLPGGEVRLLSVTGKWLSDSSTDVPCGVLVRSPELSASYFEMVFPSDLSVGSVERQPQRVTIRRELFPERLEKGVVRRGRVRGVFLAQEQDEALALQAFERFVESPLVLST